ncbi:hypothetical protein [Fimbriiglobus ruber]|uniref:hypothetical protein n=1 Tax=Fimbriiglobus ruber TaxID=1908690 RepID=UPI00117A435A|nr:hypothetical protein [Fimbriiglobus ruber]
MTAPNSNPDPIRKNHVAGDVGGHDSPFGGGQDINDRIVRQIGLLYSSNECNGQGRLKEELEQQRLRELAGEYEPLSLEMLAERRSFLEKAQREFTPRFRAVVQLRWNQNKPTTPDAHEAFVGWMNQQIEGLGLSFYHPETKQPAALMVSGNGEYRILAHGEQNARPGFSSMNLLKLVSKFEFGAVVDQKRAKAGMGVRQGGQLAR